MSSWEGKSRGNVLGYRIFVFLLKRFGVSTAYILLRFVSLYFVLNPKGVFKPVYSYFRVALGYGRVVSVINVYRNFYVFGQTLIDKIAILSGMHNRYSYQFDGEENLHKMARNNTGGLLISAHLGSWEIAGHFLQNVKAIINIVMFDAEHQRLKQYFDSIDVKRRVNIIVVREDMSHIFEISHALLDKQLVCIQGDRFLSGSKTMNFEFLGREAAFPLGPFRIATKLGVPVSFVFGLKETAKHYHLFSTPGKVYNDNETLIQDYVSRLESMTKRYPLQWFNYYDFWRVERQGQVTHDRGQD